MSNNVSDPQLFELLRFFQKVDDIVRECNRKLERPSESPHLTPSQQVLILKKNLKKQGISFPLKGLRTTSRVESNPPLEQEQLRDSNGIPTLRLINPDK